jgi:hypothetical protein
MPPELPQDGPFVDSVMAGRIAGAESDIDLGRGCLYAQGEQPLDQFSMYACAFGRVRPRSGGTVQPGWRDGSLIHVASVVKNDITPIDGGIGSPDPKTHLLMLSVIERSAIAEAVDRLGHHARSDQQIEVSSGKTAKSSHFGHRYGSFQTVLWR